MKKQENYPKKNYLNKKIKAQATIEFSMAFILAVLFLFLSSNLFVWFNRNIVQRQRAYEQTRVEAANVNNPGRADFYTRYRPLNVFVTGGYNK